MWHKSFESDKNEILRTVQYQQKDFLMRQTIINVSRLIEFDLKNEIYRKYQELNSEFYKKNRTGDLMNRVSEDVSKVRMYIGPAIMYTINTVTLFIIVVTYMLVVAPKLAFYTLLPLPFLSLLIYFISVKINTKSNKKKKIGFLIDFSSILGGFWDLKSMILGSKVDFKRTCKGEIAILKKLLKTWEGCTKIKVRRFKNQ